MSNKIFQLFQRYLNITYNTNIFFIHFQLINWRVVLLEKCILNFKLRDHFGLNEQYFLTIL